jgi:predicted TIM-barrel fold metal-dependent hydrolase
MNLTRRNFIKTSLASGIALTGVDAFAEPQARYYSLEDFSKVPKIDVHFHQNVNTDTFPEFGRSLRFHLLSVNVAAGRPIEKQFDVVTAVAKRFSGSFDFVGAFSVENFGKEGFVEETIAYIKKNVEAGAKGFKVWKNIGMVLKNDQGKFVMIDDPGLTPLFSYLEQHRIPLMGHLGEPKNCWLPLDKITTPADLRYYTRHPEYHMYHHPESPSYDDQIRARENLLKRHPNLPYLGAHLASLEWSVDEMARQLDLYPNMMLETAARVDHLQYQSVQNKERVRNFLIKYQDRVMYGSDTTIDPENDKEGTKEILRKKWQNDWGYFATDGLIFEKMKVEGQDQPVTGLKLPKKVVDKIYRKNAQRFFKIA